MDKRRVPPEQAVELMRAAGLEPLEAFPGASKPWLCQCLVCHAHVKPRYTSIKQGQGGCRACARRRMSQSQRLDPNQAAAVMHQAGYEPLEEYQGTDIPWRCRCTRCGAMSTPTYTNVLAGHRCGACSHQRRGRATRLDPDQAVEVMRAAGLEPLDAYPGSAQSWRCRCTTCQRTVTPTHHGIQRGRGGCVYCAGKTVDPDEAAELLRAAGVDPFDAYPGHDQPWRGRCRTCGALVTPTYRWVRASGNACKHCSRRASAQGQRLDPATAVEAMRVAGLEPLENYPGSTTAAWPCWCAECAATVTPTYATIRAGGGCPGCRYRTVAAVLRLSPDQAVEVMRQAGLEPLDAYPGSASQWRCRCTSCQRTVTPTHHGVQRGQGGCAYCAGKTVEPDEAASVMRAAGFIPLVDYPGDKIPWSCRCITCGERSTPLYNDVRSGSGCRHCWERRRGEALRLDPMGATEVMRAAGLEPLEDYPGADTAWRCRCHECGFEVSPTYGSVRDGHGCRYCAAQHRGYRRRLEHEVAAEIMQAAELEPLEDYRTATDPWRCRCCHCHTVLVSLSYNKVQSGRGCHVCHPPAYGFDRTGPGVVYVLEHHELAALKLGVTGVGVERVRQHQRHGWQLLYRLPCSTGEQAWRIEQAVLMWLRRHGIGPYLSAEFLPQGGFTETVDPERISAVRLWSLIRAALGWV